MLEDAGPVKIAPALSQNPVLEALDLCAHRGSASSRYARQVFLGFFWGGGRASRRADGALSSFGMAGSVFSLMVCEPSPLM